MKQELNQYLQEASHMSGASKDVVDRVTAGSAISDEEGSQAVS